MPKRLLGAFFLLASLTMTAQEDFEADVIPTAGGDLKITFIGHGSLLFNFKDLAIYVDPFGQLADFSLLPKADLIFVTHQHQDHFDAAAIEKLRKANTQVFLSASCRPLPAAGRVLQNNDRIRALGIDIAVVPAYNIANRRADGTPFHPRGEGNGYVFSFSDQLVYVAGDTEDIPEMAALKNIAIAFLPMNLPYTMTPEMAAQAAKVFHPRILYPYHFGSTDPLLLPPLLADAGGISVRIRNMK